MFSSKNILCIAAHPDDLEFSVFGTLLKYKDNNRIYCYIASLGGFGDKTAGMQRKLESQKAFEVVTTPNKLIFRDTIGMHGSEYSTIVSELDLLVEKNGINLVLAPSGKDTHQDHRMLSEITLSSLRRLNASILFYGTVSNTPDFCPTVFVDITNQFDEKKRILKLLDTQKNRSYMSDEFIGIFNSGAYVALNGVRYAEKYEIWRVFL